tara:strand:+ start:2784 stop:3338 length:555 start_codon:yes stop_codon:yes gene_type:complete
MTAPETVTRTEFALRMGFKPSYVTQLVKDGRLVLTPDGRRVLVAESVARLEATRDPSKKAVADRHAAGRRAGQGTPLPETPEDEAPPIADHDYQNARAKREHFAALREQLRYREEAGELMVASEVEGTLADILTVLRNRLETWPDTLAPQLAPVIEEQQVRARLADEVEIALNDVARRFSEVGK